MLGTLAKRSPARFVALLVPALALGAAPGLAQTEAPWLHVEVRDGSDDTEVEVNLPLAAVEAFGDRIGEQILEHAEVPRGAGDLEIDDLRKVWAELRANPGSSVRVGDEDGALNARMDGDEVRIEASGDDGEIAIRIPVGVGDALFGGEDGVLDVRAAIRRLRGHEGDLVTVTGEDSRVHIWIGPQR